MKSAGTLFLFLLFVSQVVQAQDPEPPCSSSAHTQFDFWLGDWNVYDPDGNLAGTNTISKIISNCVIHENWSSARSKFTGQSFNTYNPLSKTWHQTWVDNSGATIYFKGKRTGNIMLLSGERKDNEGDLYDRMSYTLNSDGTVRQLWEQSRDNKTWSIAFDGIYKRK